MKRYVRIFTLFAQFSLMRHIAYRPSFVLALAGKMMRVGILLLFFQFLYLQTRTLAGWNHDEVLVLVAIYLTIEFSYSITVARNLLYWFPSRLREGSFDFLLAKPINALFQTACKDIDCLDLFSSIPVAVLWVYIAMTHAVPWKLVPLVIFFMAVSLLFLFGITLCIATLSFWTIQGSGVGRMTEHFLRTARYPADVFTGGWRIFFWYVMPVGIIATLPAKLWFAALDPFYATYALFITASVVLIALRLWRYGLRHYSSASS